MENVNIWLWVGGQLIAGAAIWGAIRADIKNIHNTQAIHQQDIKDSRTRIDRLFEMHYTTRNNSN